MPSRNFWLDQNSLMTISSTAYLKLTLSITQKAVGSLVMAVDGRQISYSRANSPNPSPTFNSLVSSSSTLICTEPFWMMQKQEPTVPCLKTSAPGGISQRYILSLTLSSSFSDRLQKMKWLRRQFRMNILSVSDRGNSLGSRPSSRTLTRASLRRTSSSCRSFLMDYSIMIINAEPNSITIFSNCMLDWCRNQQPSTDNAHELTFPAGMAANSNQRCRTLAPPKFSSTGNASSGRRGIKIHVTRGLKVDQHVQTVHHAWQKVGIDFSTQTESLNIHPLNSRKNSRASSRQLSPTHKNTPMILIRPQPCRSQQGWALEGSKTIDCRNQINRQTKASYNLLESQGMPTLRYEDQFARNFKGVESYHIPEEKTASIEEDSHSPTFVARFTEKIIRSVQEEVSNNQRMMQSVAGHGQEQHQECGYGYDERYRDMLRNVESEFKFAGQKMSEKKLKYTPDKRILFHDRETIVSKYGESYKDQDRSLRVEESLVYDRDVRSAFTPLGKLSSHQSFLIFLALEKTTGQAVSIKEVQVRFIDCISEEMMTYRELDAKFASVEGILELYQTQIDRDSYLFIKEPFTASLMEYIGKGSRDLVEEVCTSVAKILAQMESAGFALKSHPKMEDFVVCLSSVKLHNAGIFKYHGSQNIPVAQAVQCLREEMMEYLL